MRKIRQFWKTKKVVILPFVLGLMVIILPIAILRQQNPKEAEAAIMHWGFDEGYGTAIGDTSTNSNTGAIINAVWRTSDMCRKDKCLYFDGSGDYVSISDDDSGGDLDFVAADDFTIMGWFRHGAISTNPDIILVKYEDGVAGGYAVYMDSDGDLVFAIDDDSFWDTSDLVGDDQSKNYDDNRWHHFAAVKDGTTGIYLYVDGVLIDSDTALTETGTLANAADFYVGIDSDGASNGWQGFIDEIKVHRELKTEAEIKADFLAGAPEEGASASFGVKNNSWLSDGLVGYWKMDDVSLTDNCATDTVADSSGNGYHGVACPNGSGPTGEASGKFATGVTIGSNQYIAIEDTSDLRFNTGDFSIFTWMYKTSTASTPILSKLDGGDDGYELRLLATSRVRFSMNATDGDSSSTISTNTWTHVGVVVSNGSAQIYINGVPDGNAINVSGVTMNTTTELRFGSNSSNFSGNMDDTRFYNRALSTKEIRDLYNWAPDPVLYLDFDENTGTSTVYDKSGNAINGTMNGSMTGDAWKPGKFGSSLRLDGSNDYLSFTDPGSNSVIDHDTSAIDTHITLMLWVNFHTLPTNGQYQTFFAKGSTDGTDDANYLFDIHNTSGTYYLDYAAYYGGYDGVTSAALTGIQTGVWQHFALVVTMDEVEFYHNGSLVGRETGITSAQNNKALWIGGANYPGGASFEEAVKATIDEVKIYNYARTAKQIIEDMNGGHPVGGSPVGSPAIHYRFDEGYGSTAYDASPNGNDGALENGAYWIPEGRLGGSVYFANFVGDSQVYYPFAESVDLYEKDSISVCAWVNPQSDGESNEGHIWSKDSNTPVNYLGVLNETGGVVNVEGYLDLSTSDASYTSTRTIPLDAWSHVCMTWENDADDELALYINGILDGTSTNGSGDTANDSTTSGFVGGSHGNHFDGYIDEFKFFNTALTQSEINILHNNGAGTKLGALSTDSTGAVPSDSNDRSYCVPGDTSTCNAPVAEWLMDENTGVAVDAVKDTSINTYDGDNTSMTEANWVPGKYGSGLRFDGTSNFVDIGPITDYEGTTNMSFSAWIRPNFLNTEATTRTVFFSERFTIAMSAPGGTDDFRASLNTGTSTSVDTTSVAWTYNEWHHLAFTYDGALMKIYWDGKLEASTAKTGNISASSLGTIGRNTLAVGQHWLGDLDQIRFYNYTRTPAQIAWDYNRGAPIVHLKFDECTGTTLNNSAPDPRGLDPELDGTLTVGPGGTNTSAGTCSSGTGSHAWNNGTTGKRNYSMDFDGVDDDVRISNNGSIDFDDGLDEAVSFAAWFYANSDGETDVGRIFGKGSSTTYCRTDSQSGSVMDLECSMDLATTDATLNISGALTTNTWHHVVMTYSDDGDDEITVYIDGINRGTSTDGDGGPATDTADLNIGSNGAGAATFDGQIDEFMLFNYELTAMQVRTIVNSGTVNFGPTTGTP